MKLFTAMEDFNGKISNRLEAVIGPSFGYAKLLRIASIKLAGYVFHILIIMIPCAVMGQVIEKDSIEQNEKYQDETEVESKLRRTRLLRGKGLHGRPMDSKRKELIHKKREKLLGKWRKTNSLQLEVIEEVENDFYMERINLPEGDTYRIECMDGYIELRAHSMHKSKKYGDVVVARTSSGEWYMNAGHICGDRINFVKHEKQGPLTESSFFSSFKSDSDQIPWIKMNPEEK